MRLEINLKFRFHGALLLTAGRRPINPLVRLLMFCGESRSRRFKQQASCDNHVLHAFPLLKVHADN
ncbi:MAG TPA: hypothetical protein PLK99_00800 [Burkholderiales bacterium]|nr:hypothetical protein [Burkholderiales bacterium]